MSRLGPAIRSPWPSSGKGSPSSSCWRLTWYGAVRFRPGRLSGGLGRDGPAYEPIVGHSGFGGRPHSGLSINIKTATCPAGALV